MSSGWRRWRRGAARLRGGAQDRGRPRPDRAGGGRGHADLRREHRIRPVRGRRHRARRRGPAAAEPAAQPCLRGGRAFPTEVVRAAMLLRANALATGASGVRLETAGAAADLLNARVHPVVPSRGSLGASGDLAPLAHLALPLVGEGEAEVAGAMRARRARRWPAAGLQPVTLGAKEGLALINGTQFMAAIGGAGAGPGRPAGADRRPGRAPSRSRRVRASRTPFAPEIQAAAAAPRPGRLGRATCTGCSTAAQINESHRWCGRVQDAYSLRCSPQVHGAVPRRAPATPRASSPSS